VAAPEKFDCRGTTRGTIISNGAHAIRHIRMTRLVHWLEVHFTVNALKLK